MRGFLFSMALLFALPAWAFGDGDGTGCTAGATWIGGRCTILCGDADGNGTCGPILLENPINSVAVELQFNTSCSAGTAAVYSKSLSVAGTRPWHLLGTIALDATDAVGISLISIDGTAAPPMRYLKAVVASHGGCTGAGAVIVVHQK